LRHPFADLAQIVIWLGALDVAGLRQSESAAAQFLHQFTAVLDMGDLGERYGLAHAHGELRPHAPCRFAEDERQAERVADVARQVKYPAVLADEEDRNDDRARRPDELRGEGCPGQFDRRALMRPLAGRHTATRKDADRMTAAQPGLRREPGAHVDFT